ncbi:MAG: TVP38/TMEM64 family protein, partial [Gemmatimonadaceae bacterium]
LRALAAAQSVIARHPGLGAALFVLLAALSAMLAFFSSAVLVPVALYAWGTGLSALLLWTGWIIGGVCAYSVGRYLGQPVVARLTSRRKLQRYQHKLSNRAPFGLVLLFQLALPSEIPGYALGMANYPMSRYLLALALAELPYVLGTIFLGEGLVQRRMTLLLAVGAAAILFSVVAWRALQRRLVASNA